MRLIVTIIMSVIMVGAIVAPSCHAEFVEPENSFCIYGVSNMLIDIHSGGEMTESWKYTFPNNASHYDNPYVIDSNTISEWYNKGYTSIRIVAYGASAITLSSPNSIISSTTSGSRIQIEIRSDDGTPLSFITKLLSIKRMYLFPTGTMPDVAGVTPTPFVNDGSDIVVDDDELNNTIGAVNEFKPFMQFIFTSVIPWAGFAAVIILVFATIKFMLKG